MRVTPLSPLWGLLLVVCHLSFLVGCDSGHRDQNPNGPVQVKIPLLGDGGYTLQTAELASVDDMVELKGWAAQFLFSPSQKNNKLYGHAPKIRTVRNPEGIYIATDELSLQMLTIYYHIEKLGMMDEAVGAKNVNTWPRTIAMNVNYAMSGTSSRLENNALYSGSLDALLFVPYSQSSLPIPVNGGIIGHEHFHSLFSRLVVIPLGKKYPDPDMATLHDEVVMRTALGLGVDVGVDAKPVPATPDEGKKQRAQEIKMYHTFLLRGLNEGLADFWGWLYSRDDHFVGRSLPQMEELRKLDRAGCIMSETELLRHLVFGQKFGGRSPEATAYQFGAGVARTLRKFTIEFQKQSGMDDLAIRAAVGNMLILSLGDLKTHFENLTDDQTLDTTQFVDFVSQHIPETKGPAKLILTKAIEGAHSRNGFCGE